MYSEPRKVIFTGLVVGALAAGGFAYVSQSGKGGSSSDELGMTRGDDSTGSARGPIVSGRITRDPVAAGDDSGVTVAARLQAARNSLLRDDVAAARAQLNALRPAQKNDEPVIELQKQVQAQADREQRALAAARVEEAPGSVMQAAPTSASASSSSASSPMKAGHSRGSRSAAHDHSNRASRYAKSGRPPETVTTRAGSDGMSSGSDSVAGTQAVASQPAYAPPSTMRVVGSALDAPDAPAALNALNASSATQQPARTAQTAPSNPQAEPTAQAVLSASVVQPAPSGETQPKPDGGAKTRSQVRAEIVRAREDGSLPAFGNPDPAGPGGAPSLTGASRR